jgi:hypothetical protein
MNLEYSEFSARSRIVNEACTNPGRQVVMAPKMLMVALRIFFLFVIGALLLQHDASQMRE